MIKNSIRQLFRTKVKTVLFLLLICLCALLLCMGCNLEYLCKQNIKRFEEAFMTMGTVEQTPVSVTRQGQWDAEKQDYRYFNSAEYGETVPLSALDMEGVSYISGPEQRAFYHVYLPEYKILDDKSGWHHEAIVIASPVEDCVPDHPVKMEVKEVLFEVYDLNMGEFYFCDHYHENPEMMYADKSYIMNVYNGIPHGWEMGNPDNNPYEWYPAGGPSSSQANADGTLMENSLPGLDVEIVDDAFYENGHDRIWEAWVREKEMIYHTIPVTATADLNLIMAFYTGDAYVGDGNTFLAEDYENGNKVCLVPFAFARRNGIKVGDTLHLGFSYANYAQPAAIGWGRCSLTADGQQFENFFEADYTVAGIYNSLPSGNLDTGYELHDNEIIIPAGSIENSDENNIGFAGPMKPYNTSFRIPNGTIDEFMTAWEAKGIDDVEIHFYDKGYSRLEAGIKQMERMALILVGAGIVMAVLVMVFFCHLMITRQKKRTAVERSLGASKGQSGVSLMSGILLIAAAGCIIGCIAGWYMTGKIAGGMEGKETFDTAYSAGIVYEEPDEEEVSRGSDSNMVVTILSGTALFAFAIFVSGVFTWGNLKEEPLQLLSGRGEE